MLLCNEVNGYKLIVQLMGQADCAVTESLFSSILQVSTSVRAAQVQARYQLHNPDAARPARRIYVGGLPPDTVDVRGSTWVL